MVLEDPCKHFAGVLLLLVDLHVVLIADHDRALAVTSAAARADASDHEACDPQEEVRGLNRPLNGDLILGIDRRLIRDLSPGLVDEGERAREDAGRRPLRKAQELVTRRPRGWVDGQGYRVVDRDRRGRGRGRVREDHVARVGVRALLAVGVLAEEPQGEAGPLPLFRPIEGPRRQHRLLAQDTRDDRAAHDRLAVAALDC